jgi:hypothetical protein
MRILAKSTAAATKASATRIRRTQVRPAHAHFHCWHWDSLKRFVNRSSAVGSRLTQCGN